MPREDLIQLRGGTTAQWTIANPILAAREPGLETDTGKVKYGNGTDDWADLPYASGGSGETDGVGCVFFGGENLAVALDNDYDFSTFIATDEPPRAPQRDDLMVIDGEDNTTINVVRSGLYDISLNVPVQPRDLVVSEGDGPFQLETAIQVWVAGNTAPPAYDYNNRAQWRVTETVNFLPTVFTNWTFPQVLQAGDTIQLAVKATGSGSGTLGGAIHLDPDITFVLTYRGPVSL